MKKHDIGELNQLYTDSESCDHDLYAEQKSNILLVSGEHYTKKGSKFWNRIKDSKVGEESKIRLTKNHMQKISKRYKNNIIRHAPSVTVLPKNQTEVSDQKDAELYKAVGDDIKHRHKFREKIKVWCGHFVDIGEVATKISFDPNKGAFLGYEAKMLEEVDDITGMPTGNMKPAVDPATGEMVPSEKPAFAGDLYYEDVYAFNLMRAPQAKSMDESPWLMIRKMIDVEELKRLVSGIQDEAEREEKLKYISEGEDETYIVFDGQKGNYSKSKGQCLLKEIYFRPCYDYPQGYYYFFTGAGILFQAELPLGIFPIKYKGYETIETSPRHRSPLKHGRPYQVEINRTASKIAEHQITLGDDKLVLSSGSKMTKGGQLPGIRSVNVTGAPPTILSGRTGEQYIGYMNGQIDELYKVLDVEEDGMDNNQQQDPYVMLFRSIKYKKRYAMYAEKFEDFLVDIFETSLEFAKAYYDERHLIPAIGKREYINIAEFKKTDNLCYRIKVEPMTEDPDSTLGKQLTLNHALQYVGKDLGKDSIGMIIKSMPFLNNDEIFSELTIDYENFKNDLLAMERGQYRPAKKNDNHNYYIKKITHRMKQGDFEFLNPMIQQMYAKKQSEHEEFQTAIAQQMQEAQAGFIPSGGYEVVCDLYAPDPNNPTKTRRLRVPSESLQWLIKRLQQQGTFVTGVADIGPNAMADIGQMLKLKAQGNGQEAQNGNGNINGQQQQHAGGPTGVPGDKPSAGDTYSRGFAGINPGALTGPDVTARTTSPGMGS